jgi:hypothetical protein
MGRRMTRSPGDDLLRRLVNGGSAYTRACQLWLDDGDHIVAFELTGDELEYVRGLEQEPGGTA